MHYFSDRCDPFKTVLPQLDGGTGSAEERVFIVESPLGEIVDETSGIHRELDWPDRVVVDERHRAFFETVRMSLAEVMTKIDQIEFVTVDDGEDDGAASQTKDVRPSIPH